MAFIARVMLWSTAIPGLFHLHQDKHTESTLHLLSGEIPGGSALKLCNRSRDTDLYSINKIELYPNPLHM